MSNGNNIGNFSLTSKDYWANLDHWFTIALAKNPNNSSVKFFLYTVLLKIMNHLQQNRPFSKIPSIDFETDQGAAQATQEKLNAGIISYSDKELALFARVIEDLRNANLSGKDLVTAHFLIAIAECAAKKQCISSTIIELKTRSCFK